MENERMKDCRKVGAARGIEFVIHMTLEKGKAMRKP
jgi:hypothetical protein